MLVKHQHKVGNALHQHLGPGSTPLLCGGGDVGSGQGRDERLLAQDAASQPDPPPDRTVKEGAHGVQIQLVCQCGVQQLQPSLPLHLGRKIGGRAVKGHALHKGVDGGAALGAGHAAFLQKGRALQRNRAGGVGHRADTDLGGDLFERGAGALPRKAGPQLRHQHRVRRSGGRRRRLLRLLGQGQQPNVQRHTGFAVVRQKVRARPKRIAARVQHCSGQQPACPAAHAAH